jgi:hypothetical protein
MPSASSPPPSKFNAAAPAAPVIWEPRSKPALTWKTMDQCEISRILKFSYCTIPFFREYVAGIFTYIGQKIGLIYGRYLQFRILELPLNGGFQSMVPSWLLDPKVHGSSSPIGLWNLRVPINSMKNAMAIHGAKICYSHAMINTQGASIGIISI